MRIPVVNLADQLTRAIPSSRQTWIMKQSNEIGLEVTLFKIKNLESFMIMTKSNLELCSKLGSMRVCNNRKTKFREYTPYFVPLDIGHNRIVVLGNVTNARIEVKTACD